MPVKPCLLIPNFDHGDTMPALLERLAPLSLPCLIVDDGSGPATAQTLLELEKAHPWVSLLTRPQNGGKGAALRDGYRWAHELGFTHVLQLDADGQHAVEDVPRLLECAQREPTAMILGTPVFEAAPRGRRWGHWVSRFWVWVETWSLEIRDPLCGLRCMPLEPVLRVIARHSCGDYMEFDPELVVRVHWAGTPAVSVACRVTYVAGGLSHFDVVRDNLRISWMHTRLFLQMLPRAPILLARTLRRAARGRA